MKIYCAHSTAFDFHKEYYNPLRNSVLAKEHDFIFPHDDSSVQFNSRQMMPTFDLVLAEVSYPSTGMGIELGWADAAGVKIICMYKKGTKPSGALRIITDAIIAYTDPDDIAGILAEVINPGA